MIYQIRGSGASGKTTLVRNFLKSCDKIEEMVYEKGVTSCKNIYYYRCTYKNKLFYVLGKYPEKGCGGCDNITSKKNGVVRMINIVEELHSTGHNVIFEGLIASKVALRHIINSKVAKEKWVFILLETDLDTRLQNLIARRAEVSANPKHITEKTLNTNVADNKSIHNSFSRVEQAGYNSYRIPFKDAFLVFKTIVEKYL